MPADRSGETARLLDLLRVGDSQARSRLIEHACERLRLLIRKMLEEFPNVGRWEQTDDVLQNALLQLHRALAEVTREAYIGVMPF